MIRKSQKFPAFNCLGGTNCIHTPKGDHGAGCERWRYCVVADDMKSALSLEIRSGIYLEDWRTEHNEASSRDIWRSNRRFHRSSGSDISLHVSWRTESESVRKGIELGACDLIDRCNCPWTSALVATEFWEKHAESESFDQPESFWLALEEKLIDLRADYADVDLVLQQCECCKGRGVKERKGVHG